MPNKPTREEIDAFEMPTVQPGTAVLWYKHGVRSRDRIVGFVIDVYARNVRLWCPSVGVQSSVRHVEDPKLRLNNDQREPGAWEYTEAHKTLMAIESRLTDIEVQITRAIVDSAKAKPKQPLPAKDTLTSLRKQAKELGLSIYNKEGKPKNKPQLRAEIDEAQKEGITT